MSLTPERIAELVELCDQATQGPFISEDVGTQNESGWCVKRQEDCEWVGDFIREEDARFWITARTAMPALLETLAEKDAEVEVLTSNSQQWKTSCEQFADQSESLRVELQQKEAENEKLRHGLDEEGLSLAERCCGELKGQLAAENDTLRTRLASLLFSGKFDDLTSDTIRAWAEEYPTKLAAELRQANERVAEAEKHHQEFDCECRRI